MLASHLILWLGIGRSGRDRKTPLEWFDENQIVDFHDSEPME